MRGPTTIALAGVAGLLLSLLFSSTSDAAIGPRPDGSYIPHYVSNFRTPVQLTNSARSWNANWVTHYNNARGWWDSTLRRSVWYDSPPGSPSRVWIVRPGSSDEDIINYSLALQGIYFDPYQRCNDDPNLPKVWASMHSAEWVWDHGHWHRGWQKICLRWAPNSNNPQGWHYWWLTLLHELGHVLSLDDDPNGCLMKSGYQMVYPCQHEVDFVNNHYGL